MPGILDLYAAHAEQHIENHVKAGTKDMISRKQVEIEILDGLDKNKFPIEMKVSWYHAILSTSLFETLWRSAAVRHKLPAPSIIRYQPKESLLEIPSSDEVSSFDFGVSIPGGGGSNRGRKRSQKQTPSEKRATGMKTIPKPGQYTTSSVDANETESDNNDDDYDDDDNDSSSSAPSTRDYAAALAARRSNYSSSPLYSNPSALYSNPSALYSSPSAHPTIDPNGLARQDTNDSDYGKRSRTRERGKKPKTGSSAKGKGKGKGKEVRFAV